MFKRKDQSFNWVILSHNFGFNLRFTGPQAAKMGSDGEKRSLLSDLPIWETEKVSGLRQLQNTRPNLFCDYSHACSTLSNRPLLSIARRQSPNCKYKAVFWGQKKMRWLYSKCLLLYDIPAVLLKASFLQLCYIRGTSPSTQNKTSILTRLMNLWGCNLKQTWWFPKSLCICTHIPWDGYRSELHWTHRTQLAKLFLPHW